MSCISPELALDTVLPQALSDQSSHCQENQMTDRFLLLPFQLHTFALSLSRRVKTSITLMSVSIKLQPAQLSVETLNREAASLALFNSYKLCLATLTESKVYQFTRYILFNPKNETSYLLDYFPPSESQKRLLLSCSVSFGFGGFCYRWSGRAMLTVSSV